MSANTSPDNITYPVSTDAVAPLETVFATMASSIQTALTGRNVNEYLRYTTLALLNAAPGTAQGQHATVYADATPVNNSDYYWNATTSQWTRAIGGGLVSIVPTSVAGTGVTVGSGGVVNFVGGSATININGCFSTQFDNYIVEIDITAQSSSNQVQFKLRASGTDDSSANYTAELLYGTGTGTGTAAAQVSGTQLLLTAGSGVEHNITLKLFGPALTRATRMDVLSGDWASATVGVRTTSVSRHNVASAFDGFSIIGVGGTFLTGTARVYGYNNN